MQKRSLVRTGVAVRVKFYQLHPGEKTLHFIGLKLHNTTAIERNIYSPGDSSQCMQKKVLLKSEFHVLILCKLKLDEIPKSTVH